jgi:predicted Fe-Mo cluster-binding NifX family protein
MKIAIPLAEGKLALHFGHSKEFAIIEVNGSEIKNKEVLEPPPHEPGVLPQWLHDLNVDVVLAGGMGGRALQLFAQQGIKVLTGAPALSPEELVSQFTSNTLQTGNNVCDH